MAKYVNGRQRKRLRRDMIAFKQETTFNRGCSMCGSCEDLTYHHINQGDKSVGINQRIRNTRSWTKS